MWMQISSGRGPVECQNAVFLFLKELTKELKDIEVLSYEEGSEKECYYSVMLKTDISNYKEYEGTVKWICQSPYRPNHKRKNWFISVECYEEIEEKNCNQKDFLIETLKSGGPGGQNVNKVETAVRVTHIESGISVVGKEERSQLQNKRLAISRIIKLLESKENLAKLDFQKEVWMQHNELERGNPSRVYDGAGFKRIK